jgi:hypothetical protein
MTKCKAPFTLHAARTLGIGHSPFLGVGKDEMDKWRTAIHEAGHAVIGRVLNMVCGDVTIVQDDDSAGYAICADPGENYNEWQLQGRFRGDTESSILRFRIMTFMAGAEAEAVIIGNRLGGDDDDRKQVTQMLAKLPRRDDRPALERRLRRWTTALCRRHIDQIKLLADELMRKDSLSDDDIRALIGIPKPAHDPWQARHVVRS